MVDIASNNDDLLDDSEEWIKAQLKSASTAAQTKISAPKNDNLVPKKSDFIVTNKSDNHTKYIDSPTVNKAEADNDSDDTEDPIMRESPRKILNRNNTAIENTKKLNQATADLTFIKTEVTERNLTLEAKKSDHSLISSSDSNILEDILELDLGQTEKGENTKVLASAPYLFF